jgi:DNA-binding PadR family transcriptional regulator
MRTTPIRDAAITYGRSVDVGSENRTPSCGLVVTKAQVAFSPLSLGDHPLDNGNPIRCIVDIDQSMATNRRPLKTTLALALLELLAEAPMHPYEMKQRMHERGHERAISLKAASIYDTVERLTKAGFIEPVVINREGRRPERTIYRLTPSGADELDSWLRQLLEEPSREYPRFAAALMFIGALRRKEEAIKVLERRAAAFDAQMASAETIMRGIPPDLPRLFVIEEEYAQAMRRAELDWLLRTVAELKDGTLNWPRMIEDHEWPMA